MTHNKTVVACLMAMSLAFSSLDAAARVGGSRSGASLSSGHSHTSQSAAAPQRAGGGQDAGMQRPEVMNKVRGQEAAAPAALPSANPVATTAQPAPARPGYGMGTVVGAAAAGAAVGYLANSAMHDNAMPQHPAGSSDSYGNPVGDNSRGNGGSGFPWGSILMLLLGTAAIMGILTYLSRRREAADQVTYARTSLQGAVPAAPGNTEQQSFERDSLKFFNDLQEANNRGDMAYMEQNSVEPMRQTLIEDIRNRTVASHTRVMVMKAEQVDLTEAADRSLASVRFCGMVSENENAAPDNIDEVWHFVKPAGADSRWLLAGIEQV